MARAHYSGGHGDSGADEAAWERRREGEDNLRVEPAVSESEEERESVKGERELHVSPGTTVGLSGSVTLRNLLSLQGDVFLNVAWLRTASRWELGEKRGLAGLGL